MDMKVKSPPSAAGENEPAESAPVTFTFDDLITERGFKKILAAYIPAAEDELLEVGKAVRFLELFRDQRLRPGVTAPHQRDAGHQR